MSENDEAEATGGEAMLSARLDGETILLPELKWEGQEAYLRKAAREGRLPARCAGGGAAAALTAVASRLR